MFLKISKLGLHPQISAIIYIYIYIYIYNGVGDHTLKSIQVLAYIYNGVRDVHMQVSIENPCTRRDLDASVDGGWEPKNMSSLIN
jgi:hypothetical protein